MAKIIEDDGVRAYTVVKAGAELTADVDLYAARDRLADLHAANKGAGTLDGQWRGYAEWAAELGFPGLSRRAVLALVTAVRADVDELVKKSEAPPSSAN